ncbi:DUF6531 domain-containing protein [bacterium]|nr:DUF6531 domain-containing protein [bacterium]
MLARFSSIISVLLLLSISSAGLAAAPRYNAAVGTGEIRYSPYLHSGEWSLTVVDFQIKGRGFDYVFARKYESQALYDGPLGQNWDHQYFMRLMELPNGDVFFYDGMGRKELFRVLPPAPLPGPLLYMSPAGQFAELKKLQDGNWLVHQPDGIAYLFNNYGQLVRIQDRNENYMEFLYNPVGQLSVVIDTMGRPISYQYNGDQKLIKVRDFAGREWKFNYDEGIASSDPDRKPNFLTSVTTTAVTGTSNGNEFPNGKTTKYEYKLGDILSLRANLTKVTNPRGEVLIENQYNDQDQLIRQKYGNDFIEFAYEENKTTVTDRNGNEIVYEFNAYGNPTAITRAGLTTRMEYDPDIITPELPLIPSDGLLTKITFPEGNSIEYTYEKSLLARFLRRRSEANLISVKQIPGPRGSGGSSETLTTTYMYDPLHNQVLTVTDPKGNVTTYERDQHGNANKITMPEGVIQSFTYNKYGQLLTETFGEGNSNNYEYYPEAGGSTVRQNADQATGGYLKKKTTGGLYSNTFVYDDLGRLSEFIDGNNVKSTYEVNALDQIIKEVRFEPLSFETRYEYDLNDNLVKKLIQHSSAGGDGFTEYRYNHDHPLNYLMQEESEISEGVFAITKYDYDANGNRTLVTDPEGTQTSYVFDSRDLNTEVIRGFGSSDASSSVFTYDGNGNLKTSGDGEGNTTEFFYDGYDSQFEVKDALGNIASYGFDDVGNAISQISKDSEDVVLAQTTNTYDGLNRLKTRTEKFQPSDAVITYNYDKNSRITSLIDANNHTTSYSYDTANRIATMTDPAGNKVTYEYDPNGNTRKITEEETGPLGSETFVTTSEFDKANRLEKSIDPAGDTMQYFYDSMGNNVITIDAEGNQTAASFDNANRRVKTEEANGSIVTKFDYDLNGRLESITDANGNTTTYRYDSLNRNTKTIYADGKEINLTFDLADNVKTATDPNGTFVTNTYDPLNRLASRSITKAAGVEGTTTESFDYDGLSRLKKATDDDSVVELNYDTLSNVTSESQNGKTVSSKYDGIGNRTEITYPSGRQLNFRYDSLNRLEKIEEQTALVAQYTYQGTGRTAGIGLNNGTHSEFGYDNDRRITAIRHVNATNQVVSGFSYGWNRMDQRNYEQKLHENGRADVYSYDAIYRLTQMAMNAPDPINVSTAQKTIVYNQDDVYNFKQITETEGGISRIKTTQINNRNQYTVFDNQPLSYDPNGNTKNLFGKQLTYDYANRLTRVVTPDGTTTTMTYDALGRRTSLSSGGQTTNYVWSGQQTLEEFAGAGLQASYVYGRGIDEIVQMKRGGQAYYYHMNSIGSVKAITDSTGKLIERYDYDAYGNRIIRADQTPPAVEQVRLRSGDLHVRLTEPAQKTTLLAILKDSNNQNHAVTTAFEEGDRKIILHPTTPLAADSQFVLTIQAGLTDLALNKTATAFQQSLTVSGDEIYFDNKAPEVAEITIANGRNIKIRFSEEISDFPAAAISLVFNNQPVVASLSFSAPSLEATLSLAEIATPGAYTVQLSSAVKDETGKPLSDFQQILIIAGPDQVVYRNEKDVVSTSIVNSDMGFQGRKIDSSSGLAYFRARYLDPVSGRFTSPDPRTYVDSFNIYQAFGNNPVNAVDPLGLDWFFVTNVKNQPDQWEWHDGIAYSYADKTGRIKTPTGYKHLLVAKHIENDITTGAKIYQMDMYNQNTKKISGRAFSGGEFFGFSPVRQGNYTIRADLERDTTGPTAINPDSALCNPYPAYGLQVIPDATLPLGPATKPTTCGPKNPYGAYGPKRARLIPWQGKDEGYYLHGQIPKRASTPGATHGCLCYGTDTRIIDYLWTLNEKVPVAVDVPVKQPPPPKRSRLRFTEQTE